MTKKRVPFAHIPDHPSTARQCGHWHRSRHKPKDAQTMALDKEKMYFRGIMDLRAERDQAYLERNHVVAALARLYPSEAAK